VEYIQEDSAVAVALEAEDSAAVVAASAVAVRQEAGSK
jgi:hypothetical protein